MQRCRRHGPPKHLEKMLFINHKEDLMLDDKLIELNLRSRQRVIELDLERIRVQKDWRNSRKKNMTLSEAIAAGILPPEPATVANLRPVAGNQSLFRAGHQGQRRPVASAPARKKASRPQTQLPRAATFFKEPRGGRESMLNSFPKQPAIPENEENVTVTAVANDNKRYKRESLDTVGTYVLDEFEKVSQVVPDILRALAKKKEQYEEEAKNAQIAYDLKTNEKVNLVDYEPDMNKVRKTVSSVKKLRHRMAISKKLEVNKPKKSFDQMVKDRTESIGDQDEFSDGICALMKRKLDKKKRDSVSGPGGAEREPIDRRHSLAVPSGLGMPRRMSSLPDLTQRRSSVLPMPSTMSRGGGSGLGLGSPGKLGSLGGEGEAGGGLIDEDELINRQRIMKELGRYQLLQGRVDKFLLQRRPGSRTTLHNVLEQIAPIT